MTTDDLSPVIERLKAGSRDETHIQAITAAIASGKIVLANAPGAVGIGGDASGSQIVTGHSNVTGDRNIVIYGTDAQTIQAILNQYSGAVPSTRAYLDSNSQPASNSTGQSLLGLFDDITADMTADEIAQLPKDGAEQHDHYIYGIPKRPV